MPPNCCQITDQAFTEGEVRDELRAYRKRGPAAQTRMLLNAVRSLRLRHASLIDIGGGVGAIYHELLGSLVDTAVHVDASSRYLTIARQEAERLGHGAKVEFIHGDFTAVAAEILPADLVTLDRVVCCYPQVEALLGAAAVHAKQALAMSYPRNTWYVRLGMALINAFQLLRGLAFRSFVHSPLHMHNLLRNAGLKRVFCSRLPVWEIAVYVRDETLADAS